MFPDISHKFDMLAAIFILFVLCALMLHFDHDTRDVKSLDWAIHGADLVLGAIVGGLTVNRGQRPGDK